MKSLSDVVIAEIIRERDSAPWGEGNKVVEQYAKAYGMSLATMFRKIAKFKGQKRTRKADKKVTEEQITLIAKRKHMAASLGLKERNLSTGAILEDLAKEGLLDAGSVSVSTVNSRLTEMGYGAKRRYNRVEPTADQNIWQIDFSRSEYFELWEMGGNPVIKVNGRGQWSYKNKAEGKKLTLWVVAAVHEASRLTIHQYYPAVGESLPMVIEFLRFAWLRPEDQHRLRHLPDVVRLDQGATGKSSFFRKALQEKLNIEVSLASSKSDRDLESQAQGKVERRFRSLWGQFELRQATSLISQGNKFISLSELNELVHSWNIENQFNRHPAQKDHSCVEVYEQGLKLNPGRLLQTDVADLILRESQRTVNNYGNVSIDGTEYKTSAESRPDDIIRVYTDMDGVMKGENVRTGGQFDLVPDVPLAHNEFKSHGKTLRQKLADMPDHKNIPAPVYAQPVADDPKIIPFKQAEEKVAAKSIFTETGMEDCFDTENEFRTFIGRYFSKPFTSLDADLQRHLTEYGKSTHFSKNAIQLFLDNMAM